MKLASQDPLNGRLTVGLMRALAAAGDRVGAIEQASIYEVLIEEEVELPPDRAVVAFAERLRTDWVSGDGEVESWRADTPGSARTATAPETMWENGADTPNEARSMVSAGPAPTQPGRREYTWRRALVLAAVTLLLLSAFWLLGAQPTDSTARRPSEIHSRRLPNKSDFWPRAGPRSPVAATRSPRRSIKYGSSAIRSCAPSSPARTCGRNTRSSPGWSMRSWHCGPSHTGSSGARFFSDNDTLRTASHATTTRWLVPRSSRRSLPRSARHSRRRCARRGRTGTCS